MDVKKLVVGFLILAAAAGSSVVILSTVGNSSSVASAAPQIQIADVAGSADGTSVQTNAFLPQAPAPDQDLADNTDLSTVLPAPSDPDNLTDDLADNFLNGVVTANPNGPQTDSTGNPVLTDPDTQEVAMLVASTTAAENLVAPNWNLEAQSQTIKTTPDNSIGSVSNYSDSLNDIVSQHFVASGIEGMSQDPNDPDPTQAGFIQSQVQAALGDTLALQVPTSLDALQKSFVTMLVYQKNILGLVQNANDDPVKTSLILQQEQNDYNAAVQSFQTQTQNAGSIKGFSFGAAPDASVGGAVGFMNTVLGIKTANAQFLTFDSANFGEWLLKFANDAIVQILKNTLIALVQKKVLAWIQGSGAPRFIQQWGSTLVNAYTQSAIGALNSTMECVNSFYAPQMKITLGLPYSQTTNNVCANSFQAALGVNTLPQFLSNFESGGWIAYGASMNPSGNYYDQLPFQAQTVANAAQTAQQAAIAKSTANQGQTGDQVCNDNSNPNGTHQVCTFGTISGNQCVLNGAVVGVPITEPNDGNCANGQEPNVTTPGLFTGFSADTALKSNSNLLTAAQDISGLLNAMLSSLLSSLTNAAVNAAGQAVNGALSGSTNGGILSISSSTIMGGGTPPPALPLMCNPISQTTSSTVPIVVAATGGKTDASGNQPIYTWISSDGSSGSGPTFTDTYLIPGSYTVTLNDSTGDPQSTCTVVAK